MDTWSTRLWNGFELIVTKLFERLTGWELDWFDLPESFHYPFQHVSVNFELVPLPPNSLSDLAMSSEQGR